MSEALSIQKAADLLRRGELVAFPTETVYGLGADALNPRAIDAVFRRKGRPSSNPLIVHVLDAQAAGLLTPAWSQTAQVLADAFWPGPLTLVLPRSPHIPDAVTAGGSTVALRCPAHPVALALLECFGGPLVGPSANPSGYISPTRSAHVLEHFPDLAVLEGGPSRIGIESTVLSLDPLRILRPGAIGADAIEARLGSKVEPPDRGSVHPDQGSALPSPGLLTHHYAPRTPARMLMPLADAYDWTGLEHMAPLALLTPRQGLSVPSWVRVFPMAPDPSSYAAGLYATLRQADAIGLHALLIEQPWSGQRVPPEWIAVADRLGRATAE